MKISISNIAWDPVDDEKVAAILGRHGVGCIDVAPGKYFPEPAAATPQDIEKVRDWWHSRGIAIIGMQALLFGTTGLNVFGTPPSRSALLAHLSAVCRIAAGLGVKHLVFGSPKNRDRSGLSDGHALDAAVAFFREAGDIAARHGAVFCLEPNPPRYGANFMVHSEETATVVAAVDHPAIRMQLDTGAMAINQEDPAAVMARYQHLIGHVHASEPDLVNLGLGGTDHAAAARAVRQHRPDLAVAIEMLPARTGSNLAAIESSVALANQHYGDAAPVAA